MTTTLTQGIEASLAPFLTAQTDPSGAHRALVAAKAAMGEQVFGIVSSQGSPDQSGYTAGWSTLLDPDACPTAFLPFLSMFNGTGVPPGTDDADARAIIKAEAGFNRGTPAAIVATAQRFLTGSQSCMLLERTPDAYSAQLVMRPEQCPNQAALEAAVLAIKPAGIVLTFLFTDGEIWNQATRAWSSDTTTWAAKG